MSLHQTILRLLVENIPSDLFVQPDGSIAADLLPQLAGHLHSSLNQAMTGESLAEGMHWLTTVAASVDVVGPLGRFRSDPLQERQQGYLRALVPNLCRFVGSAEEACLPRSAYDWLAILPPRGVRGPTLARDGRWLWQVVGRRETWHDAEQGDDLVHLLTDGVCWIREGDRRDVALTRTIRLRSRSGRGDPLPLWHGVVKAVADLHAREETHGDLRPACLVRVPTGAYEVRGLLERAWAGAALARQQTGKGRCILLHEALQGEGSSLLASPQVLRGRPPTPADDVYALASIAYQLYLGDLLGSRPSGNRWREELRERGAAGWLLDLLGDCWKDDPSERPAHAGVVLERIEEGLAGQELELIDGPVIDNLPNAAAYLRRARDLLSRKELAASLLHAERALQFGRTTEALTLRAKIYLAQGELEPAVADANLVLRRMPTHGEVLALRGEARHRLLQYDAAVSDLTRALAILGPNARIYGLRAAALHALERFAEAAADAEEALHLDANTLPARWVRAFARYRSGAHADAIRDCDFVLEKEPDNPQARRTRALARAGFGDFVGAMLDFDRALGSSREDLVLLLARGDLQRTWKHPEGALSDYLRVLTLSPGHPQALAGRDVCLREILERR